MEVVAGDVPLASAIITGDNCRLSILPVGRPDYSSISLFRSQAAGELESLLASSESTETISSAGAKLESLCRLARMVELSC